MYLSILDPFYLQKESKNINSKLMTLLTNEQWPLVSMLSDLESFHHKGWGGVNHILNVWRHGQHLKIFLSAVVILLGTFSVDNLSQPYLGGLDRPLPLVSNFLIPFSPLCQR